MICDLLLEKNWVSYRLIYFQNHLALQIDGDDAPGPVFVDFVHGAVGHRRQFGGGKNQLIAKAVGIKSNEKLRVLDVTAGLGRDAFVLATLGCDVLMCERSPVIYALLQDGLARAEKENWFQKISLKLIQADAIVYLQKNQLFIPDVIYIDPMFPEKTKSALVKKEMRVLRSDGNGFWGQRENAESEVLIFVKRTVSNA